MKKILLIGLIIIAVYLVFRKGSTGPSVSQNGISLVQFVENLMAKYDSNADGKLSVNDESFLRVESNDIIEVESRGLLFTDADVFGNNDGVVTSEELMNYLSEFDTDNDGEITSYKNILQSMFNGKSEWTRFDEQYAERFKYDEK